MLCALPCHAARTTLSRCAQSQHPERPVERSEPGVAGFRDYARNDEVEGATLCGEYRVVTLHAHPCHARTPPAMPADLLLSRCAHPRHAREPFPEWPPIARGDRPGTVHTYVIIG